MAADLRGAVRLAAEATAAVASLSQALHGRIARVATLGLTPVRGGPVSGAVYASVRGVAGLAGRGLDAALARLPDGDAPPPSRPKRDAIVAALNGVMGDHLAAGDNPLAIRMRLCSEGRPLDLEPDRLARRLPDARPDLVVLLHGLCMNDAAWTRDGFEPGRALAHDLGFTALHLRYNTGLHVAANGREFAALLQQAVQAWPVPLRRIVLVGHSMGGLVARSAIHAAPRGPRSWRRLLTDLVCIGTPHQGAPMERIGQGVTRLLAALPIAAPLAGLGRLRSAGITDLRHGTVLDESASRADRFAGSEDRRRPLPLPRGVRCHAIAAAIAGRPGRARDGLLGDGLVPLDSALGRHADPARALAFPPEHVHVIRGIGHLDLLADPEVYATMRRWLAH